MGLMLLAIQLKHFTDDGMVTGMISFCNRNRIIKC